MKLVMSGLLFILAGQLILAGPAAAQEIETRGGYCNDSYFNSDGGGISGCMEFAVRYDDMIGGIGLFGATPEYRGRTTNDPLEAVAKLNVWYGQEFEDDGLLYTLNARAGFQGGLADDLAIALQDSIHSAFGFGNTRVESTQSTSIVAGVSGSARRDYGISDTGSWGLNMTPYGHAAIGNDTIEAGAGFIVALQPTSETKGLALALPKNGAYAPTFGGDGIGIFGAVRFVAHESLYDDLAEPFVSEAGVTSQVTLWDFVVLGASASCTTMPYEGAGKADCKANLQMGGLF